MTYTCCLLDAVLYSSQNVFTMGKDTVDTGDLLAALVNGSPNGAYLIMEHMKIDGSALCSYIDGLKVTTADDSTSLPEGSQGLTVCSWKAFEAAKIAATERGFTQVGTDLLLLCLCNLPSGKACETLRAFGVSADIIRSSILDLQEKIIAFEYNGVISSDTGLNGGFEGLVNPPYANEIGIVKNDQSTLPVLMADDGAGLTASINLDDSVFSNSLYSNRPEEIGLLVGAAITLLASGTSVQYLESDNAGGIKVRVLSGSQEGREGWIWWYNFHRLFGTGEDVYEKHESLS